jgi:arylsulfatase A
MLSSSKTIVKKGIHMKHKYCINIWAIIVSIIFCATQFSYSSEKPNILLIVADDLGYGDIGCYGNRKNKTPNLDRLAKEGLRFTDFHSNGPMCSPTRAALLTGRYQQRMGIEGPIGRNGTGLGQCNEITIASQLRDAGYATGIIGKWHLGTQPSDNPINHGFSTFHGHLYSAQDYHSHVNRWGKVDWWHNDTLANEEGYNTHLITKYAVQFIQDNKDKPFFLYVPYSAIHFPWMTANDKPYRKEGGNYDSLAKLGPHNDVTNVVKHMVEELDKSVGTIVSTLHECNLDEKTFVFFTSDNGGYLHYANRHQGEISSNGVLRGQKTDVFEGGHRVPAIAKWPKRIKPDSTTGQTVMTMDIMPTCLELAGLHQPKQDSPNALDGTSITPVIFYQGSMPERTLFFRMDENRAVRQGQWKLVWIGEDSPSLFNLDEDLGEKKDLSQDNLVLVEQLKSEFLQWQDSVENE